MRSSNAAFGAYQPPIELTKERVDRWIADLGDATKRWWVAVIGSKTVGVVGIGPSRDPIDAGVGELDTVAVLPECWRQGVGTALVRVANAQLDRSVYERAVLWTWTDYVAADAFYTRLGWQRTNMRRDLDRQVSYLRHKAIAT